MPLAINPPYPKVALCISAEMNPASIASVPVVTQPDRGSTNKIWNSFKESFKPVPKLSSDCTKDRFSSDFTSHVRRLSSLVPPSGNNDALASTIKDLTSKGINHKATDASFREKDSHLLTQLGRLPQVVFVPVLDWAPFGLSQRLATLHASALWNLVKTFDTSDVSLQKLHALLV